MQIICDNVAHTLLIWSLYTYFNQSYVRSEKGWLEGEPSKPCKIKSGNFEHRNMKLIKDAGYSFFLPRPKYIISR